jgi:amino acid adenylation domain-containing protein
MQPIGPDDLVPLFPMAIIEQEVSSERYIEIPGPAWPHDTTIGVMFDAAAGSFPNKVAIQNAGFSLTFAELQSWANGIAGKITATTAAARGQRVCMLIGCELASTAALLGLIKTGGVSMYLSPHYPSTYQKEILQDADVGFMLATSPELELAHELAGGGVPVINCDRDSLGDHHPQEHRPSPQDPVWIAYTSGSTGRPKGVVHSHRSVLNFTASYIDRTKLQHSDRVASLHRSRGMDSLAALLTGASTYALDLGRVGFTGIGQWMMDMRISIVPTVPTALRCIATELQRTGQKLEVRLLRLSGEPLSRDDLIQAAGVFPEYCHILNWYGSTEVGVASWTTPVSNAHRLSAIPAGKVFGNIEVRIIDHNGSPAENNCEGEITVGSDALFKGYWRQPELNAQKISTDPQTPGRRWFKTGDTGYFDTSGTLFILGRNDDQIKINGFRVEPVEIEAALRTIEDIDEAVISVVGDSGQSAYSDTLLAAYIVTGLTPPPPVPLIRRRLLKLLPPYMVPSYFVLIDTLPRLRSGKPDKRALPTFLPHTRVDYNVPTESGLNGPE